MTPTPTPPAIPVCPECGTPVAFRRTPRAPLTRTLLRAWSVLSLILLLAALATAQWMTRYDDRGNFASWQPQVTTPGTTLSATVTQLRAMAGRADSGDAITRSLIAEADADWAARPVGGLLVSRSDGEVFISTTWCIGWPFTWASITRGYAVADAAHPNGPRIPLPSTWTSDGPHVDWKFVWGSTVSAAPDTRTLYSFGWWAWAEAALALVLLAAAFRLVRRLHRWRSCAAARRDPTLPDPLVPPGRRRRWAVRIAAAAIAVSMLIPTWRHAVHPKDVPLTTTPGAVATITVADLDALIGSPGADGALAARLIAVFDAADQYAATTGGDAPTGEAVRCSWVWSRSYSHVSFGLLNEYNWVAPTLGFRRYRTMTTDRTTTTTPYPRRPLECKWTGWDWIFEIELPTADGDPERRSIIIDPRATFTSLGLTYVAWRLLGTPWTLFVARRSRRRWLAGRCVGCAYPVDRPDSPAATA